MDLLPRGKNHHILQHRQCLWLRGNRRVIGHQHVDMRAGQQEARYTHNFVGTNRNRSHARWNACRQARAGSRRRQLPFQNRFALRQRVEHYPAGDFIDPGETTGEGCRCGPLNQLQASRFQGFARIERLSRVGDPPAQPERKQARDEQGDHQGRKKAFCLHGFTSAQSTGKG